MINKIDFDTLKKKESKAYQEQKKAYKEYKQARDCTNDLYEERGKTIKVRAEARRIMLEESEKLDKYNQYYREIWDEFGKTRDQLKAKIKDLEKKEKSENRKMLDSFDIAVLDEGKTAQKASMDAHRHKDKRNSTRKKIKEARSKINRAREEAERNAPQTDSSDYQRAKAAFNRARDRDEATYADFVKSKEERNRLKAEHEQLNEVFLQIKEEVQRQLNECYQEIISKEKFKERPRKDGSGKIDIYFGGLSDSGDGPGHGHIVIEPDGNVSHIRLAWSDVSFSTTEYEFKNKIRK